MPEREEREERETDVLGEFVRGTNFDSQLYRWHFDLPDVQNTGSSDEPGVAVGQTSFG